MLAILCQMVLLAYHQVTTLVDLHPFNGARNYSRRERLAELGGLTLATAIATLSGYYAP